MAVRFSADGQSYSRTISLGAISQFSVACWMKISADENDDRAAWCIDDGNAVGFDAAYMGVDSDGTTLRFRQPSASAWGTRALTVGTWYYVGVSVNGVNGTMISRAPGDTSFELTTWSTGDSSLNAANWRIGRSVYSSDWLNGAVAAVKMWTATLSQAELENEAWTYRPGRTANLRAWHPLLSPDTADYSGGGFTLTGGTGATTEDGPGISWGLRQAVTWVAPPTLIPKTLTDSASASDALTVTGTVALPESAAASQTFAVSATVPLPESATGSETLAVAASALLADAAATADSVITGVQKTLTDGGAAADVLGGHAAVPLGQAAAATEVLAGAASVPLGQTGTAADTLAASPLSFKSFADDGTASDALTGTVLRNIIRAHPPRRVWSAGKPTRYPAG